MSGGAPLKTLSIERRTHGAGSLSPPVYDSRMPRRDRLLPAPSLDLTPMIDCVFLLLTFFFFALALTQRLNVTEVDLPVVAAGTDAQPGTYAVLELSPDGALTLDRETVDWNALADTLQARLAEQPGTTLLIATDRDTPVSEVFRLMDVLSAADIRNLRFLREPAEAPATAPTQGT